MRTHAMERNALIAGALAMGLVVLVSNIAVGYPINDWLTWGALTYPLAFLVTDLTNLSTPPPSVESSFSSISGPPGAPPAPKSFPNLSPYMRSSPRAVWLSWESLSMKPPLPVCSFLPSDTASTTPSSDPAPKPSTNSNRSRPSPTPSFSPPKAKFSNASAAP